MSRATTPAAWKSSWPDGLAAAPARTFRLAHADGQGRAFADLLGDDAADLTVAARARADPDLAVRLAVGHLRAVGGGAIVNVSSRGAFRGEPNNPAYGASKAGMNAFGLPSAMS